MSNKYRRNCFAKGKEFPPPLTTTLIRRTGLSQPLTKEYNFVRRSMDDGKRLVIQAEETNDNKKYYLIANRANGRLTMNIVPFNNGLELETNCHVDDDDYLIIDKINVDNNGDKINVKNNVGGATC